MEGRLPVFTLNLEGFDNNDLARELAQRWEIEARPGIHCAPLAHQTLGSFPQGALRLSPGYFNREEEIDRCLEAIRELASH
jgi:selenocysteine lyase/cysteine desulfurase